MQIAFQLLIISRTVPLSGPQARLPPLADGALEVGRAVELLQDANRGRGQLKGKCA
jgi:hypothetical protein